MVTKAFVEELISPHKVRVRIPLFDRPVNDPYSKETKDLNIATISTLPNCSMNYKVGDVVYVAFEDNSSDKVVVIGSLSNTNESTTFPDFLASKLNVIDEVKLPSSTTIGELTPEVLNYLTGLTENVQRQLNSLKEQQDILRKDLDEIIQYLNKGGN